MLNPRMLVGDGEHKVLALHGIFTGASSWAAAWPHLDSARFTYAFMDCRGYGAAMSWDGSYTMAEIASDALALADRLGWQSFSLVGHSMGGMSMQRVYAEAPERVRRMVGVAPVPATGMALDAARKALFEAAIDDPAARQQIVHGSTGERLTPTWSRFVAAESSRTVSREAMRSYLAALQAETFEDRLAGSTVPVKVILGAHDPSVTAERRQWWPQCYPGAEVEVMENAGHYPMDECPVAFVTSMEEFLGAGPQTSASPE